MTGAHALAVAKGICAACRVVVDPLNGHVRDVQRRGVLEKLSEDRRY